MITRRKWKTAYRSWYYDITGWETINSEFSHNPENSIAKADTVFSRWTQSTKMPKVNGMLTVTGDLQKLKVVDIMIIHLYVEKTVN